jgi:hypothetical protein
MKQMGNRGCYVEIEYELKYSENQDNFLQLQYNADSKWELACKMGVLLFKDYFFARMSGGIELSIINIGWMPVDTNNLIVMFAIVRALADEFKMEMPNLDLNTTNEVFTFPEPRSVGNVS